MKSPSLRVSVVKVISYPLHGYAFICTQICLSFQKNM